MSWTGSASGYVYQYRDLSESETDWRDESSIITEAQTTVNDLTPGHKYEFIVIAIESDQRSDASAIFAQATRKS